MRSDDRLTVGGLWSQLRFGDDAAWTIHSQENLSRLRVRNTSSVGHIVQ